MSTRSNPSSHLTSASDGGQAWRCRCEVCTTFVTSAPAYFKMAFNEPRHLIATSEGIADALGFCPRHGAELLSNDTLQMAAAQVFADVIPRVLPLLEERNFGAERFQQIYFSAHAACPACAYEQRAVGRHAAQLGRQHCSVAPMGETPVIDALCLPHFHGLARGLKPELRMPALARHGEILEHAARSVEGVLAAGISHGATADLQLALEHALGLAAGAPIVAAKTEGSPLAETLQHYAGVEQSIACDVACPVCMEVERSRQRWLATVPIASAHHLDDWLFFPTCAEHISTIVAQGDARLTAAVAAHALHVGTEYLHQQLRVLVRAAETQEELAAARIARWGRRPRRKKSDPPKPPTPKIARCAACERLAIAEMHATGRILRLLQSSKHRQAFESGYGLCMKHHAQAYLLAPKGDVRTLLATDQARRLNDFMCELHDEIDAPAERRTASDRLSKVRLSLRRFCGFA